MTALSHLTCVGDTRDKVDAALDGLAQAGIRNVLALRGDLPEGMSFPGAEHFRYAAELIAAIRKRGQFCVGAACYPEGHPESPDRDADLDYLRRKQDAGADFLTTQMVFDNDILVPLSGTARWPRASIFPSRQASCPWSTRGRFAVS